MIACGEIAITTISSFTVTSHGTNRSVQQVCQLIADDKDVCNHLPLCCRLFSKCCLAQLVSIPNLQLHQIERWEDEVFIQQEKKDAQNIGQTFKKPYKMFSTW